DLTDAEDRQAAHDNLSALAAGQVGAVRTENRYRRGDGTTLWVSAHVAVIEADALVVVYQPIVAPRADTVVGHEALVRIRQPDGALLGPDKFIAVAEEAGLINALGGAVLARACAQQAAWTTAHPELRYMAVNVSARQLASPALVDEIQTAL